MFIAEIFHSIQGEGRLVGQPSAFVRTSGCNLRCWYCDTPYTSWEPEGKNLSVPEIVRQVESFSSRFVVITGGEPMLSPEIEPLCAALRSRGWHITIETAATVDRPVVCDLMSLSPKLGNSTPWQRQGGSEAAAHEAKRHAPEVVRRMVRDYDYQLKFVIDQPQDVEEVRRYLLEFPEVTPDRVFLMPQATSRDELHAKYRWLGEACKLHAWRLGQRLHLDLYGHQRGT